MKNTASVCLALLGAFFLGRAVLISYLCVCGSCGLIFNPWALVFVSLALGNTLGLRCLRKGGKLERWSLVVATVTFAFMLWSTSGYILMIMRGQDYFDLLLFIPLVLAGTSLLAVCFAMSKKNPIQANEA